MNQPCITATGAISAGVISADRNGRVGFHSFRHSLATALLQLKLDPKTVQGVPRHEDFGTTMELYAAVRHGRYEGRAGQVSGTADGRQNPPVHGGSSVQNHEWAKAFEMMAAREGVEPRR
jgi:hypothetical protein